MTRNCRTCGLIMDGGDLVDDKGRIYQYLKDQQHGECKYCPSCYKEGKLSTTIRLD